MERAECNEERVHTILNFFNGVLGDMTVLLVPIDSCVAMCAMVRTEWKQEKNAYDPDLSIFQ